MAEKPKKRLRRIKGQPLAEIRKAYKAVQKAIRAREKWREEWIEKSEYFKDQIHWNMQVIFDANPAKIGEELKVQKADDGTKVVVKGDRVVVERLPDHVIKEDDRLGRLIQDADQKAADVVEKWALRAGCNPRAIDPHSGVIKTEDAENVYEDFDPSKMADPTEDVDATDEEEGSDL